MSKKKNRNTLVNGSGRTSTAALSTTAQRREQNRQSAQTARRKVQSRGRSKSSLFLIIGVVLALALIVGIFVFISQSQKPAGTIGPSDPTIVKQVSSVSPEILAAVGTGRATNQIKKTTDPPLKGGSGRPEIFYYGAEYCPYCAGERWAIAVALSRFGSFNQLPLTMSTGTDVYPNTSTFTFLNTKYTSSYIDFVSIEEQDRNGKPLQTPTADQKEILTHYNVSGYPFVSIANQYTSSQPLYVPDSMKNMSQKDIANQLSDKTSDTTQTILGGANYLTAAICKVTKNQPANVCTADPIPSIQQRLTLNSGSDPLAAKGSLNGQVASLDNRKRLA